MKKDFAYYTKLEEIMNSININGFQFHDIEDGKDYEWKPQCGPQPLDKVEEVIAYKGQDIMTYYFVKKDHVRSSELINNKVDWEGMNESCHRSLLRMYSSRELAHFLKHAKFASTYSRRNQYLLLLFQLIMPIYHSLIDCYAQVLEHDVTENSYFVMTGHKERGELIPDSAHVLLLPFSQWLKKHGMDTWREMLEIDKKADVVVMAHKDLCDGNYELTVPYASDWKELC